MSRTILSESLGTAARLDPHQLDLDRLDPRLTLLYLDLKHHTTVDSPYYILLQIC